MMNEEELKEEFLQITGAMVHDNVDTSLSTMRAREKRLSEILAEAEKKGYDVSSWEAERKQEERRERLKRMLESRFKFYCRSGLSREEHHKLADALVQDLMSNEISVLEAHLEYHKAQGFYGSKEMWEMIQRAQERVEGDIMEIFPIADAIVHALLDSEEK